MKNDKSEYKYLLLKRGLYYRPNSQGYTGIKEHAGRYRKEDEKPDSDVFAIHEDDAEEFSTACWDDIKVEYLKDKIKEYRDCLKVFADCADQIDDSEDDEEWAKFRLLVKDYRRARDLVNRNI